MSCSKGLLPPSIQHGKRPDEKKKSNDMKCKQTNKNHAPTDFQIVIGKLEIVEKSSVAAVASNPLLALTL